VFKDTLQSVVRRTLKPHTKQLGFNRTIRDPFSRNRYSQGFLNFTNEIKGPQFKLGLKDRFGNFRSTKIRLIKQIEEQQDNDYYLNINEKSDFCRKKLPISNPVFLSKTLRQKDEQGKAYLGPLSYDYVKPINRKSYHFNLNNKWF